MQWRNGDVRDAQWDALWDSHLGEMALDGPAAGDVRLVQSAEHDGWARVTDGPIIVRGNGGDLLVLRHSGR